MHRMAFQTVGAAGDIDVLKSITMDRISGRKDSQKVLRKLGLVREEPAGATFPRNLPAYEVIQKAFPDFNYHRVIDADGSRRVLFEHYPLVRGCSPTLADLVREAIREPGSRRILQIDNFTPTIQRKADILSDIPFGDEFIAALLGLPAMVPPRKIMRKINALLKHGSNGGQITIFCPVCPDYATQATGDPQRPFEYTFNGLGEGIGLVAQRILKAIIPLAEFFLANDINAKFVVSIGDFEVMSQATLDRVGLDREEFIRRVRMSQRAFAAACPNWIQLETPLMMTDLFAQTWEPALEKARAAVARHDFGALKVTPSDFEKMCAARRPLYQRWYGNDVDAHKVFLEQIPEYMATGYLVEKNFENVLILGADSVAMATFLQGLTTIPRAVVYLRSANY